MKTQWITLLAIFLVPLSCSKTTLSERDSRRDQLRNSAENKRAELGLVAGTYFGNLTQQDGSNQNVTVHLEVKDIPTAVEGQVDPVLVPVLAGFFRFNLSQDPSEYVGFTIEKADFDPKMETLNLVVFHESYQQIIFGLQRKENELFGSWTGFAASGQARLTRSSTSKPVHALRGEYTGILFRGSHGFYQYGKLTVNTTFVPPNGLRMTAVWRVIFGPLESTEYLTYQFENIQFNPVNGQLVLKNERSDVSFTGQFNGGKITGEWQSNYTGKLGTAFFDKITIPEPPQDGQIFEALRGTYRGEVKNTNSQSNLPKYLQASFVTSQDLSQPSGVKITGALRFYFADFDSLEYIEMPLTDIQYNFFTNHIVGKTSGDARITLKATVSPGKIQGKLSSDGLGELADTEVIKQ